MRNVLMKSRIKVKSFKKNKNGTCLGSRVRFDTRLNSELPKKCRLESDFERNSIAISLRFKFSVSVLWL